MIPVTQTKVVVKNSAGEEVVRGNCLPAVIASILELPITEVPNIEVFYHIENSTYWAEIMHAFLESKGWELMSDDRYKCFHHNLIWQLNLMVGDERLTLLQKELTDKYYLVSGDSPRGIRHICIYQNGKLIHDPHPTREGLVTMDTFQTLEKSIKKNINVT